jgi:hypothetical protein
MIMELTTQDRIELMRAVIKAPDRQALADYLVQVLASFNSAAAGVRNSPCPTYDDDDDCCSQVIPGLTISRGPQAF